MEIFVRFGRAVHGLFGKFSSDMGGAALEYVIVASLMIVGLMLSLDAATTESADQLSSVDVQGED